ncbi:MAG: hypothetical protein VXZ19_07570 [Pseudomonadota bacterium]|nr:hypothetical protein [Pseudomonadota bacterium]
MESRYQKVSLDRFTDRLCADSLAKPLGKVDRKFVQSMLKGISGSRSLNLTEIARALKENISLHATHKRLSRNLYDEALVENISERLLRLGSERVGPNTRLIVHVSELHKKFARKIEFLPIAEENAEAGFKVCEIIASEPESKTYFPLLTHVWSHEVPGFSSDAEEVFNSVRKVLHATSNQGMVFIDNGTVSQAACDMIFADRMINYMILVEDRSMQVRVRDDCFSLEQMLDRVETRYGKILYKLVPVGILGASQTDLDLFVHAGCSGVKIPSSGRPVNFISLRTKSSILEEHATPFLTTQTDLRSRKALMGLVDSFLSMGDILSMHRTLRDSFKPENFRVLSYKRLQLLMTLLAAVIGYEVSVSGDEMLTDQVFAKSPHDGQLQRTYLLPENDSVVLSH